VKVFERDFANGYLFGELLYKHGLLQNFEEEFVDEANLASKRQNFSMVQRALRESADELGVKLTQAQVNEIMDEDRGSSLRMLYQLRRVLSTKAKGAVPVAQGADGHGKPRLQKQVKTEEEENFFDQRVKTLRPIDQRYPYEAHNKAFVDEHTRQLRSAREQEYQELVERSANVQEFRRAQHKKMESSKAQKELARRAGEQHWQGVQEKKYNLLEKDLNFEKEMIRRDQLRIATIRENYAQDCGFREGDEDHGIAWFEKNLQRIGIDTSEHSGTDTATIEAATLKELHEKMTEKLPTKARLQIESAKRMEKIRDTKRQTDIARKERERRQRRVQYEQAATTVRILAICYSTGTV
ncbi:Spef2, partial [Symbiodinium pilosum]